MGAHKHYKEKFLPGTHLLHLGREQGRTQEFFPGGQDYLQYSRDNASEGAKRPSGGGCGRGCPPATPGSFCNFEIEIERSGAHFGWIFLKKFE